MRLLLSSACAGPGSSSLARAKRLGVAQDGRRDEGLGEERRAARLSVRREDAGGREVGKRGEEGLGPGRAMSAKEARRCLLVRDRRASKGREERTSLLTENQRRLLGEAREAFKACRKSWS